MHHVIWINPFLSTMDFRQVIHTLCIKRLGLIEHKWGFELDVYKSKGEILYKEHKELTPVSSGLEIPLLPCLSV